MENRFIRLKEVVRRVGISRSNIYRQIQKDQFPKPIALGPNSVAWLESEINAWVNEKVLHGRAA